MRVAVFDNDGTLWTEKPMPTQLHYLLGQWKAAATADPALAEQQPYHAAVTGELAWLGEAIDKHYGGDDADLGLLIAAVSAASAGASVEEYEASVAAFYREARHLTLHSSYAQTVYQPMVELLRLLNDHGFRNYIVSGGERDFMRPMSQDYYSIPPHRVIGTAMGMEYDADDNLVRFGPKMDFFDDGTEKPVRIWMRVAGRRRRWPSDCSACCRRTRSTRTGRCSRRASAMRCSMSRTPRCRSRSRRCCTGCLPPVDRPAARSGHTLRIRTQLTWWFSPLRRIAVARPRVGRMLSSRLGPLMESQKVPAVVSASVSEMSA